MSVCECVHYIISRTCIRRQCDRVKRQHLPAKTTCSRPFKYMAAVARTKLNDRYLIILYYVPIIGVQHAYPSTYR